MAGEIASLLIASRFTIQKISKGEATGGQILPVVIRIRLNLGESGESIVVFWIRETLFPQEKAKNIRKGGGKCFFFFFF